ncbi:WGR domain-containing protein [Glycomyces sp. YM15]|uniref:WGR domain-containing protein n=1 Tax=Glycomyces sp. YM15 TaxID=2800446 RepID=UPI00196293E5|nr:WGR domain-containing protein [Glycomyces sp. YM15]
MTDPTASRHFGMPVPTAIADHDPSLLAYWTGGSEDLVEAHLNINYAYFGAVDKSLSGFVVVDDEGDDYTLVDVRGGGQVWWQSHETRDLELQFDSFADWKAFKREVEEADADENDGRDQWDIREAWGTPKEVERDGTAPTSTELADRYQWLVWFLAQPLIHEGRPTQQAEDFASSGAGHYMRLWPNPEAERRAFEAELPLTAVDPHLAVYWLLHTGILAQDEYRARLLAVLDEREQPELVQSFRAVFGELALDGDVPVVPDFRERRALVQQYRCAPEYGERAWAALRAMVMDPKHLSIGRASWVLHALDNELLDEGEVITSLVGAPVTAGTELVRAEIDRRAGRESSDHASTAMRMALASEDDWPARFWGFDHTFKLVEDAGLLAEAGALALGKDPYVRIGLDMLARAHELGADDAVLTAVELLGRRPLAEASTEVLKALKESPEAGREILGAVADPEVAEVLAQRLLCRADFDKLDAAAVEWAVTTTLAGSHPDRVELAGRGLEQLPLDALASVVKVLGDSVDAVDSPLVPVLARILERLPEPDAGDFLAGIQADDVKQAVFRILFPFAHEPVVFDAFMRLAAEPAPESTIEQLWEKLFNPFEESTYLLPRLTDEQAERAARAMIGTILEHPGIQARNTAGHQLYRFHHLGAQDFLLAALTEYGDRYAHATPGGRELSHGQTEESQLESVVDNLYSAVAKLKTPESRAALIERLWTERRSIWRMGNAIGDIYSPEVHVEVMRRLRETRDHLAAAYYAYALDDHVEKRHPKVKLLAEIATWPLPEEPEVRRQFKYALIVGIEAALAAKEFELVRTACSLAESMGDEAIEPDALVRHRDWTNPLDKDETKRALEQVLSGEADAVRRQLVQAGEAARAAGEPLVKITDEELETLAGCAVARRLLADKGTGEIWFLDTEGEMHAFDGYALTEPPFRIEPLGSEQTSAFLAGVEKRTEHAVLWAKGAQEVADLARYGERIAYHWGVNCGRLDGRGLVFDGSESAAAAYARLKATAEAAKFTEREPWYVPGTGAVKRRFHKPGGDVAEAMAFDPATFVVDAAKARELGQWELTAQRDEGYALSVIETTTWDGYKVREDLTVEEWIKARIRHDGQSPAWHVRSLSEIADYLGSHGFAEGGLSSLAVEIGSGASEAEIAAFEAGREHPIPEQLREFWSQVGHASWSLNGRGTRILSPAESIARRSEVRAAGAAMVAKLPPHVAESLLPVAASLDVLSVRPDGEPDLAFSAVPRSAEDDRVFVQLGGNLSDAWWERSLSWMFAVGALTAFAEAVVAAAPETRMLFGGQALGAGMSVRRFEADTKNGRKFWEVVTDPGLDFVATRYGTLGSDGKVDTKRYADPAKAGKKAAKLIAAKEKQGYREISA